MDGTRYRRMKDAVRQAWYGRWRTYRFARHMGMEQSRSGAGLSLLPLLVGTELLSRVCSAAAPGKLGG